MAAKKKAAAKDWRRNLKLVWDCGTLYLSIREGAREYYIMGFLEDGRFSRFAWVGEGLGVKLSGYGKIKEGK